MIINRLFFTVLSLACISWVSPLYATTGYFALGYGANSNAMAGATVAAPQDAMIGAVNPAGIALIGETLDVSLRAFNPIRKASLDARMIGGNYNIEDKSSRTWFFIPGAGISHKISNDLWLGLTLYGNGGMNTSYSRNLYDETAATLGAARFGAAGSMPIGASTGANNTGRLGVDLSQAILATTLAFKVHPKHSIGISALFGAQQFEAKGLGNFQCFTATGLTNNPASCNPASGGQGPSTPGFTGSNYLTDNGHEWLFGIGTRVGWIGELHPQVTVGGAYTSKIFMTEFDDYKELFAEQGAFDIPAHFQVGIALRPLDTLQLAFDFQRIFYGDVKSIANKGPVFSSFGPAIPNGSGLLGAENGLGFGWQDINVYRIGGAYMINHQVTFRAGYSWNDSPIADDQLLFNIISPAVNTRHITAGISYRPNNHCQWNIAYTHAFHESQQQQNSAFGVPASISMHQNAIELGFSWQY